MRESGRFSENVIHFLARELIKCIISLLNKDIIVVIVYKDESY